MGRCSRLVLTAIVIAMALILGFECNETPKRLLVDMETQEHVDKYLKQRKVNQFVGVEECKIVFIATEKGE